ncbi:hypothetical protein CR194_12090 [Salipaludibacillus keqinensis]|uniref:Uncharacterized protein n=1 Tax=Salipaludibacillus keqinensis TaxID=2045207 RepID=A0A323TGA6_9BACI|nr:hypothetical protein [Salipaludibacillus keqinensis]PYZ93871.1 hypothetical protein CR194_12090 [Salipaludibacillus keqinensis]
MTKRIQAFFKNENDAERASAKLAKVNTTNQIIDKVPEQESNGRLVLIPAIHSGTGAGTAAGSTAAVGGSVDRLKSLVFKDNREQFTHILEFEVAEANIEEALQELRQTEAYIDEELLKDN